MHFAFRLVQGFLETCALFFGGGQVRGIRQRLSRRNETKFVVDVAEFCARFFQRLQADGRLDQRCIESCSLLIQGVDEAFGADEMDDGKALEESLNRSLNAIKLEFAKPRPYLTGFVWPAFRREGQ
ncbi:hypothetical protein D2E29_16415 [Mycobacteroides abscessus]|nr:hypothetical protein DDJ73_14320 [Mycobacteroides abscessus]RIQ87726.1 hypothetical protein D2E32_05580 [Mycobacteroides abscessus]RIR09019.1 hypothetical protein D2E29_16415 [Mycobacteroides abscessus]RIS29210.1 hypothetical protein D2E56_04885 [Mycobacteroides abscessus]RIT85615.1 hypothetical protein D2E91_01995 [Mycobacteroides abscessus]